MLFLNLICYKYKINKATYILFISSKYGWVLNLTQNKKFLFYLNMFLFGIIRKYYMMFNLKGFGYRFLKLNKCIIIKLGFAHRVLSYLGRNNKLFFKSRAFITISSRIHQNLRSKFLFYFLYYRKYAYKKLGIFFKGLYLQLKLSKKKNKF